MSTGEVRQVPDPAPDCLLSAHGLTKRYGSRDTLAGLSLSASPGEIVGLVGSNGSGKTTALRILAGLLRPDAGLGCVLGLDLVSDCVEIRCRVGYLSQRYSLYANLTVKENLRFRAELFGVPDSAHCVSNIIDRFGLRGFESVAASQLSGGWARLLQLAAALVHAPRVVLLDEPTAGLDVTARQAVWRQVARVANEGAAVVLSTHDLADASRCSRIILLSGGITRASGRPSDLVCASYATVLAISGSRVLGLGELLQTVPGVIASYPNGECLRVVVTPGKERNVLSCAGIEEFVVERVSATLDDAVLALSAVAEPGIA
jgi:ABC-2 type transport system ATP-binding protein